MTAKTATEELELTDVGHDEHGPDEPRSGGNGGGAALPAMPQHAYLTGIILALAAITMFFLALTSSFIVRKGLADDWVAFPLPPILWLNTALLLASSVSLERARRELRRGERGRFQRWWALTTALGLGFLAGQLIAWQQLAAAGVYLASNPSSSFFYVLTGSHGLHLLGGVIALSVVGFRPRREDARLSQTTAARVAGVYWHFMGGLWVYLLLLLLLGQ
ncbi:MAG: cytochrome c oxidase subunit 3 [Candidatus Acidiferrales bacterium]